MTIDWQKWWPNWNRSVTNRNADEPVECEPYMVTVAANHTSGDAALFDSEHRHSGFVSLRISSAERSRGNGCDWIHPQNEIIEVCMSHAQWAAMISSPNSGNGTPGTLRHIMQQRVEQPIVDRRTEKFGPELVARMDRAIALINSLRASKLTKAQLMDLTMIKQEIEINMPYVAEQFSEHMETRTEKAKSDIEAHMNTAVQRVGLAALAQSERLALLLEGDL